MEIEQRMGMRVRSSYEDVVAWIRSGGGPPVPYPKRTELQLMDSHVYSQLNAMMSAQETQRIVNEYRRDGFGRPPPGGGNPPGGPPAPPGRPPRPRGARGAPPGGAPPGPRAPPSPGNPMDESSTTEDMDLSSTTEDDGDPPPGDFAALLGSFDGRPPLAPGAGAGALSRDPLVGPSGPPVVHHPGRLLPASHRQYDRAIINAGQVAAAAAGRVALGLVARAVAKPRAIPGAAWKRSVAHVAP